MVYYILEAVKRIEPV